MEKETPAADAATKAGRIGKPAASVDHDRPLVEQGPEQLVDAFLGHGRGQGTPLGLTQDRDRSEVLADIAEHGVDRMHERVVEPDRHQRRAAELFD